MLSVLGSCVACTRYHEGNGEDMFLGCVWWKIIFCQKKLSVNFIKDFTSLG